MQMKCPKCGKPNVRYMRHGRVTYYGCSTCGHRYQNETRLRPGVVETKRLQVKRR
jgi:uncharacterized Zn finger protein (UPF0148 family)